MKQKLKYLVLIATLAVGGTALFVPATVNAADCKSDEGVTIGQTLDGDCADTTSFAFQCGSTSTRNNVTLSCLVGTIIRFLSVVVGILVVGGITVGGIVMSTSKGNPAGLQKGVTIITNSVLGLVLFFLMFAIINFLVPGGVLRQ